MRQKQIMLTKHNNIINLLGINNQIKITNLYSGNRIDPKFATQRRV